MNTRKTQLIWLLLVALLTAVFGGSAGESEQRTQNRQDAVYLKGNGQWHSLEVLIDTAWQYLRFKTNVPPSERHRFVVLIDPTDTNNLARVSFGEGIGNRFWEVRIGFAGQAQGFITGSIGDIHRTLKPTPN